MPVSQITDHVETGLSLLIEQYQEKPRLAALLTSFLQRVQDIEDANWEVLVSRLIDTATGVQLDVLGKIVGQPRVDEEDELYRLRIRTRIRANRSLGTPEDVIAVALMAAERDITELTYTELYPASFIVETPGPIDSDLATLVHEFLLVAKAIGTAGTYHYSEDEESSTFAFSDTDEAVDDTARGYGGDDPTTGDGGLWIGAL